MIRTYGSMPREERIKSESGVYHVMLRGINRQQIFNDEEDNAVFLATLKRYCNAGGHKVYAYCLMGNHVHIVLREGHEPFNILMRKIGASFVRWYNLKYSRAGSLYQDRYKSEPIEDTTHLVNAIRYLHMNPVNARLCAEPSGYLWSSFHEYAMGEQNLVSIQAVLRSVNRETLLAPLDVAEQTQFMEPPEPKAGLTDVRARAIIMEVSGCADASAFARLDGDEKARFLQQLCETGLSVSQLCRLTGTSYALARKYQR